MANTSAQLYKDKEVPQAVASGAIEMGIAPVSRFAPVYEWYLRQAGDTGQKLLAEARKLQ